MLPTPRDTQHTTMAMIPVQLWLSWAMSLLLQTRLGGCCSLCQLVNGSYCCELRTLCHGTFDGLGPRLDAHSNAPHHSRHGCVACWKFCQSASMPRGN
eukprot:2237560-Amphidinium_carterae.1